MKIIEKTPPVPFMRNKIMNALAEFDKQGKIVDYIELTEKEFYMLCNEMGTSKHIMAHNGGHRIFGLPINIVEE